MFGHHRIIGAAVSVAHRRPPSRLPSRPHASAAGNGFSLLLLSALAASVTDAILIPVSGAAAQQPALSVPPRTPNGDAIEEEMTRFLSVKHAAGVVSTGWTFRGASGVPKEQYCYYAVPNEGQGRSSTVVDIAYNGHRLPDIKAGLVPDLESALQKCQWYNDVPSNAPGTAHNLSAR